MRQLALSLPNTWGGRRPGAGRTRLSPRPRVPHRTRPFHYEAHPVHVTLRAVPGLASLRTPRVFPTLREAIRHAQRDRFRICEFSVQSNHVHLLVEARDRVELTRGLQGLVIRLARAVNRALKRTGKVWGDRYHRHDLATPREVRHALVYVLMNHKKHGPESPGIDICSSGPWFTGWRGRRRAQPAGVENPVLSPRTWLLAAGWRRLGLVASTEHPRRI